MANNTDWLNISQMTGGTGETALSLTALTNSSLEPKTATITARNSQYNVSDTTTVTIQGFVPTLTLSRSTLRFDSTGGTATFTVYSNTAWTINFPAIVHSYSTSAGTGDTEVTVVLAPNPDEVAKVDTGIVKDVYNVNQLYLTIVQESFIVELYVEPTDDIVFKNTGSTTAITIDSNADWELEYPSWVTPSITSGESGTTTVILTAGLNGPTDRSGQITVYAGSKYVTINVFQPFYIPPYITVTPSAWTFNYTEDEKTFVVDSYPEWTAEIISTGETHWGEDIAFKLVMYISAGTTIPLKQTGVIVNGVAQKGTDFTATVTGSYTFLYPYTGGTMPVFYDWQSTIWSANTTLREVEIYDLITTIPQNTFRGCSYLSSITIGSGVTNIGQWSFSGCISLNNINITAPIAPTIDKDAFLNVQQGGVLDYPTGSDYSSWLSLKENYLGYYNWNNAMFDNGLLVARVYYDVTSTTEPVEICAAYNSNEVPYAFKNEDGEYLYFNLHSQYYTFKHTGRAYLDFIYSPKDDTTNPQNQGLQTICLSGLSSVTEVIIYDYPRTVSGFAGEQTSKLAASSCPNLTAITINRNTQIPNDGNNSCFANVTTYSVGGSVSEVPSVGNQNNYTGATKSLQTVQIATTGNTIFPSYCFASCTALTWFSINASGNIEFGSYCFASASSLTNIVLPDNVVKFGSYCFRGCSGFSNITIPTGITGLPVTCFQYCTSLTSVTIPNTVTEIRGACFSGCTSLGRITSLATTAPSLVTVYGSKAFAGMPGYGTFYYPAGSNYSSWQTQLSTWTGQEI